jgi:hypothetical protein
MSFEKGFHTLDITDTNITRISELIGKIPFEKVFISDKKLKNFFKNTKTKVYVNQRPIFDKKSHKCK